MVAGLSPKAIIFFGTIFLSKVVLSYIDPGTGGVIASSLWPLILAFFSAIGVFLIKYFWNPIKKVFLKLTGKKAINEK